VTTDAANTDATTAGVTTSDATATGAAPTDPSVAGAANVDTAPATPGATAPSDAGAPPAGPPAGRLPRVRWDAWFLVVAIVYGVFLAVATPPLQEHDAVGHLIRVDRMSRGTFVEPLDGDGLTNASIDGCVRGFIDHHSLRGGSGEPLDLRGHWADVPCTEATSTGIPTSSLTSPVPYLPNAVGYTAVKALGGGVGPRVLGARLASLAVYVGLVFAALRLAPKGRSVLFVVAVLPSSLALAASLHADALGIAAAVLAVALTLRARERPTRGVLVTLAVTVVVLALAKNLYSPHVLLVALVPAVAFADARARLRYLALTAGAWAVAFGAWSQYAARQHYALPPFGIDSREAQSFILDHPFHFLRSTWNGLWDPFVREITLPGFVEVLGGMRGPLMTHTYGDLPPLALFGVAALVLALAVFADPGPERPRDTAARRRTALVCGLVAVAGVLLVYLGMALTANPPGADTLVWAQGRYFIPLVPLLAFAAGRRLRHQPQIALAVPAGSLVLLAWVGWRISVVFY
jgi:Predicted membrane protein (DUF2142)